MRVHNLANLSAEILTPHAVVKHGLQDWFPLVNNQLGILVERNVLGQGSAVANVKDDLCLFRRMGVTSKYGQKASHPKVLLQKRSQVQTYCPEKRH